MRTFNVRRLAIGLACVLAAGVAVRAAGPGKVTAPPAGGAALPATKPAAFTWRDYFLQQLAYNRETLAGAYKRVGKRGGWDDDAVKFLDRAAYRFTYAPARPLYQPTDIPTPAELVGTGKALTAAGCIDPLVRYCYAVTLEQAGQLEAAGEALAGTAAELEAVGYPSHRVWAAAEAVQRVAGLDARHAFKAQPLLVKHAVLMACGKLDGDGHRRLMFEQLWAWLEPLERWQQVEVYEGIKDKPDADPWIKRMLEGVIEIKLAWDSRGYGWGDTVTEEGWRGFHEHLTKARDALTAAHKLAPQLPNAAVAMITVAMGAGEQLGEKDTEWFKRAIAAQLDSREAYDGILSARQPRWGGSHEEMYEIGVAALASGRYDVEGPWQFYRAIDTIGIDSGDGAEVYKKPGIYDALDELGAKYVAAHKTDGKDARYITFRAALAWRTERYAVARKHLESVGDRVVPEAFRTVGSKDYPADIGHAWTMSGPRAAAAGKAEAALARDDKAALQAFREIRGAKDLDPRELPYLDARIARLDREIGFRNGDGIDVQPRDAELKDWTVISGKWRIAPDGALVSREVGTNPQILLNEPLGNRFEWSGRIVVSGKSGMVGFLVGQDDRTILTDFLPTPGMNVVRGGGRRAAGGAVPPVPPAAPDGSLTVVVTYDNDTLRATVNGVEVQNEKVRFDRRVTNGQIGLTLLGEAKFTNLKVRKLVGDAAKKAGAGPGENDGFD